jgi:hypothetical protein
MKKSYQHSKLILLCLFAFLLIRGPVYAEKYKRQIDLKVSGGWCYLDLEDWNAFHEGWNESRRKSMEAAGGMVISENQPLHWGWEMEGEFCFHLGSQFSVSLGTGYIHGKVADSAETLADETRAKNFQDFRVRAIPLKAKGYYILSLSPRTQIALGGGPSYYFTRFKRFYRREPGTGYWIESDFSGNGSGFGLEASVSLEYLLKKHISIIIEGSGRYAKISGITGTRDRIDSNNWSDAIEGSYYTLERERSPGEWYPVVNIDTMAPSGEGTRNVRDAAIDLSGFSIRLGIKIHLY